MKNSTLNDMKGIDLPLNGIRIVDFSWIIAGPTATRHLAIMGAEVIKVGSSRRPDPSLAGPPFEVYNQSKKYCQLNLSKPESIEIASHLVSTADVVIENFAAGVFERMGYGYDVMKIWKPDIVMISSAGTGHSGPDKDFVAYGSLLQHYTGWNTISGSPTNKDEPIKGGLWADPWVGMELAMITMAALNHRMATGDGKHIDYSMAESLTASISPSLLEYQVSGELPKPIGNSATNEYPHGLYPCYGEDKWIAIRIDGIENWRELCRIIGANKFIENPDLDLVENRKAISPTIDEAISNWTRSRDDYSVMTQLQNLGIEALPSLDISRVYDDPYLRDSGYLVTHVKEDREVELPSVPWAFELQDSMQLTPAPKLGAANSQIYEQLLGIDPQTINSLIEQNIIY